MIILHIITSTDVGGAEMTMFRLVNEFNKKTDIKQYVFSIKRNGKIADKISKLGIPVYSFSKDIITILRLIYVLKKSNKNILIQSWLYHADFIGSFISVIFRIRIIWNIRQTKFSESDSITTKSLMKLCSLLSYTIPSHIVCVANAAKDQHVKFGYCKNKMLTIHNGYLINDFFLYDNNRNDLLNSLNIDSNKIIIGFVARFHPLKDYITFINTAKSLLNYNSTSFIFLMVGKGFDEQNFELLEILKKHNLLNFFRLVGNQDNVNKYYSIMDIFCLTSLSEGFPNVLVEAMMMNIPVFSTRCGDAELILQDKNFLFDFKNYESLTEKILIYLDLNNDVKKNIIKINRDSVIERFSMNVIFEKYLNLYKKTLQCVE